MTPKEGKNLLFSRRNHQPVCGDTICGFVSTIRDVAVFRSTDRRRKGPDEKICRAQEKVSSNKPTIDPRKATEQARTLALSGSLSIFRKENKKSGFKAPLHREPKNKKTKSVGSSDHSQDQEDAGAMSSSHDTEDREEEPELDMEQDTDQDSNRDGGSHRDQEEERSGDGDRDQDRNHDGDRDTTVRSSVGHLSPLTRLSLQTRLWQSCMDPHWETLASQPASPDGSPCWMLPLTSPCG
ncbi:hypothetical protein JOB18_006941 [Solea senegalensis]|uniref:Uncharacterized protein n=1 Tax=Solea senegalensis TaxID=28829 RepID=A0AAV6R3V8_SOLSE|nr:hypothetical protein JOB18_006941 [Solea senegalensis]